MIKSSLPILGCQAIEVGTATCSIFVIFFNTSPLTGDDVAISNSTSVRSSDIESRRGNSFSPAPKTTEKHINKMVERAKVKGIEKRERKESTKKQE
jgi:hypothetical protein